MRDTPDHEMTAPSIRRAPLVRRAVFARVPPELHRELRMEAAARDLTLGAFVETALRQFLRETGQGGR